MQNNSFSLTRHYSVAGKFQCCESQNENGYNEKNIFYEISWLYN